MLSPSLGSLTENKKPSSTGGFTNRIMIRLGFLPLLGFASLAAFWIAYMAWSNRDTTGAVALGAMAAATGVWAGGSLGITLSPPGWKLQWLQTSYLGMVAAPISFFTLSLKYTGHKRYLTSPTLGSLLGLGGIFLGFVWTNPLHELYWADVQSSAGVWEGIVTTPAPCFWGFVGFTYLLLAAGSILLVQYAVTAPPLYRGQVIAILLAVAVPWAANVPHALQLTDADFTPVALLFTAVALWGAMSQYQLTDLGPISLRTVFESISIGVIVLDVQDRVVDLNTTSKEMLSLTDEAIGAPIRDLLPGTVFHKHLQPFEDNQGIVEVTDETSAECRYYEIRVTQIETSQGEKEGRVLVLEDVTEEERRRQQLERQNEKLTQFTSVVSHDLRNPLNVALGNLSLEQETHDSEFLTRSERALHRMEKLIDGLLALAQAGLEIKDTDPVDLGTVVSKAWETVETDQSILQNNASVTIETDQFRLHQLLENLIRNAIDHGEGSMSITIDDHPKGFYVADDGPGISEEHRANVFEPGYSTHEQGSGFGLVIVKEIAEAHGWELHLRESDEGGARFDITGVEFCD